jgi:hypothetical protein
VSENSKLEDFMNTTPSFSNREFNEPEQDVFSLKESTNEMEQITKMSLKLRAKFLSLPSIDSIGFALNKVDY